MTTFHPIPKFLLCPHLYEYQKILLFYSYSLKFTLSNLFKAELKFRGLEMNYLFILILI